MALGVAGSGYYLILCALAILTFTFIFCDVLSYNGSAYDSVVMASDSFTNDAVVMALVLVLAYGLLPSHSTANASSFICISICFLIVSAVPVVAMPGGVQKRGALAAKAALMIVGGKVAVAVGKRSSDEPAATKKPKRSKKSKKVREGSATQTVSRPVAPKLKSAHALREDADQKSRNRATEHGNATAPGKEFMVFVNADGKQCEGSEVGHLLTSHVDLYGRIKGFLEPTTTAASKHPKVQEAKD